MPLQLYDKLLQFPLFLGMSTNDLRHIIEHTRLEFVKYEKDKAIIKEGQLCDRLYFLTDGVISVKRGSDNNSYSVEEFIHAPHMINMECLFGLTQRYSSTYKATTQCHIITIDKQEILKLSDDLFIFKINIFNLLSTKSQKLNGRFWRKHPDTVRGKIIRFIADHSTYPAGKKIFKINMQTLAGEISEGRLKVSAELNEMERASLLSLHRGGFTIPALERLLM